MTIDSKDSWPLETSRRDWHHFALSLWAISSFCFSLMGPLFIPGSHSEWITWASITSVPCAPLCVGEGKESEWGREHWRGNRWRRQVEGKAQRKNVWKVIWGRKKGGLLSHSFKMPALYFQMGRRLIWIGWCLCWNVLIPAIDWHFDLWELQVVEAKLTRCSGCSAFLLCILLILTFIVNLLM